MTEADWLSSADPEPMLEYLRGRASERKLRLFAVACCRRIWPLIAEAEVRAALEVAEQFADGNATEYQRALSECNVSGLLMEDYQRELEWTYYGYGNAPSAAYFAADAVLNAAGNRAVEAVRSTARCVRDAIPDTPGKEREQAAQVTLLRCSFGNPFRPVTPDPAWQTPNAVTLAQTMYESRDFAALPLLADLLEEAGCPADVSTHCRSPGPHARGCWVVDLMLGKE